jgi:hypothetical protein
MINLISPKASSGPETKSDRRYTNKHPRRAGVYARFEMNVCIYRG